MIFAFENDSIMVQKKLESEIDCVITDLRLREKRLISRQKWLDNSLKKTGFLPPNFTLFWQILPRYVAKISTFCPKPTRNFRFILRLLSSHFWREINLFSRNLKSVITQSISDSNFFAPLSSHFQIQKSRFFADYNAIITQL